MSVRKADVSSLNRIAARAGLVAVIVLASACSVLPRPEPVDTYLLPGAPAILFLLWVRGTFDLASWPALAAAGGAAVAIYAGVYLLIGASGPERRMYSGFAFTTLHVARGYWRRS